MELRPLVKNNHSLIGNRKCESCNMAVRSAHLTLCRMHSLGFELALPNLFPSSMCSHWEVTPRIHCALELSAFLSLACPLCQNTTHHAYS